MEQRSHKRIPLIARVMLLVGEGEHSVVMRGMVADISLGGAGLYLVQPLEVGATVTAEIRFLIIGGGIKTEHVRGTVIYSHYIEDIYYVGIQFDQALNPQRNPALYRRIQDNIESG